MEIDYFCCTVQSKSRSDLQHFDKRRDAERSCNAFEKTRGLHHLLRCGFGEYVDGRNRKTIRLIAYKLYRIFKKAGVSKSRLFYRLKDIF
mgnify:CR=1 FL=1